MRISVDWWAMNLADCCKDRSTCLRRAVGCVLLDESNHVLSTGVNGVHAGAPHCNEPRAEGNGRRILGKVQRPDPMLAPAFGISFPHACAGANSPSGTNLDGCEAIHAEQNALLQCRDVREVRTAYVTTSPCVTCTKLLLNTGCVRIVFLEEYPQPQARELWEGAGRLWERLESEKSDA